MLLVLLLGRMASIGAMLVSSITAPAALSLSMAWAKLLAT